MATTDKFHISNLGSFGGGIPTDIDGYVYLTAEGWMGANVDAANHFDDPDTGEYDAEYHREWAEEKAAQCRDAVKTAEAGVADWQANN